MLRHISNVNSVDKDFALGDVIETWDQINQGGFSAARAADDRRGLAGLSCKRDVFQHVILSTRITERYVSEFDKSFLTAVEFLRFLRVDDDRFGFQHFADSHGGNASPRYHDKYYRNHQEGHDNQHGILHKSQHVTDLHGTGINLVRADPNDENHYGIQEEHHYRH